MANEALDTFLAENAAQEAPAAPQATPGTGLAGDPRPSGSPESPAKPEAAPAPSAAPAKATPEPEPDDDAEPPAPQLGDAVVPRRALEDERHKRRDWKEKASRYEGENAELRRQLEEAKRTPAPQAARPPQPPPQMQPLPDPQQDPVGFARAFAIQQQQEFLNERLNNSELFLREKVGDEKVTEYVNEFKQHAERDPALYGKLYQQTHPYGWMMREVDRLRLMRDVGDDPAAFRSRIEAEARAKWEQEAAERGPAVPQAAPIPGMQPSLANARSVASRTAPQWSGEPSLEDVLSPVQNRKAKGGNGSVRF